MISAMPPVKDELHWCGQYDIAHKGDMFNNLQASGSNGLPYVLQPGLRLTYRFGKAQAFSNED